MRYSIFAILIAFISYSQAPTTQIEVKKLLETTTSWDGVSLENYPKGRPKVTVIKLRIPPKTALKTHKHPVVNIGYMLKGELTVTLENGKQINLKEGEAVLEVFDRWHYGKNQTDKDVEILLIYAGAEGAPITILKEDGREEK